MDVLVSVLIALGLGVLWVVVLRRSGRPRRLRGVPKDIRRVLDAYRGSRWAEVAESAPPLLARAGDDGDQQWRPALELALGQALVELDRPAEAIPHLERGLLLQSAVRRSQGGGEDPQASEAKLRHLLGWAYASTGRTAQARREYQRVLQIDRLDPEIRDRVRASLDAL